MRTREEQQIDRAQYDAANRSQVDLEEAQAAVGKTASLTLTGTIIDAGESDAGVWVRFELDERWGFEGIQRFVMDFDPFELNS